MLKKRYTLVSAIILFFISSESYSFMSGVKTELDGGQAFEVVDGVIHQGPPSSSVNVAYGILRNNTDEDIMVVVIAEDSVRYMLHFKVIDPRLENDSKQNHDDHMMH